MDRIYPWMVSTEGTCVFRLEERTNEPFRIPFYSWMRLFLLSYLVLPQTQGAKLIYFNYVSPFIAAHEHDIEVFIANAHERAGAIGLTYVKKFIELVRDKVLGLPPPSAAQAPPSQPQSAGYGSAAAAYSANLLSRFSIPSARVSAIASSSTDIYSLLTSAVSTATASSRASTSRDDPTSNLLAVPSDASSPNEKLSFIASQREKLTYLVTLLDRESSSIAGNEKNIEADVDARLLDLTAPLGTGNLGKKRNKSEHSFENIDREELPEDTAAAQKASTGNNARATSRRTASGNWLPTSWFGSSTSTAASSEAQESTKSALEAKSHGKTSGFEAGQ